MNRLFLHGYAAWLRVAFLVVLLALPGVSQSANRLMFAFSEASPPYSSLLDGKAAGLFPELVQLAFSFVPDYAATSLVMPWARAQYNVRHGLNDGFLTYPSERRQDYAVFSTDPLFTQDFGHLVYSADNPNRAVIESATSFADLADLIVIVENGSKWEEQNIPGYLERMTGQHTNAMMHLLMLRQAGDFLVQPAEDARLIARQLGYSQKLRVRKVDFIPNSLIPFHIGVSRKRPYAEEVIRQIDAVMRSPEFKSQSSALIERYR